jgi:riboflavin kinase/FMN adenylyltransferase
VVIGFNHHFGHNREGDYSYLYELGKFYHFGVEEIPEQDIHNETVSSTLIRKA